MVYHTSWLFTPFLRTLERTGGPFCRFSFIYIVDVGAHLIALDILMWIGGQNPKSFIVSKGVPLWMYYV